MHCFDGIQNRIHALVASIRHNIGVKCKSVVAPTIFVLPLLYFLYHIYSDIIQTYLFKYHQTLFRSLRRIISSETFPASSVSFPIFVSFFSGLCFKNSSDCEDKQRITMLRRKQSSHAGTGRFRLFSSFFSFLFLHRTAGSFCPRSVADTKASVSGQVFGVQIALLLLTCPADPGNLPETAAVFG